MTAAYLGALNKAAANIIPVLKRKGVHERYLQFGGPETEIASNRVPTDARSEFLANRAMGDWAEDILSSAIRAAAADLKVVQYGDTDSIAAGDDGFREAYLGKVSSVQLYGKRPDLLLFPPTAVVPDSLSNLEMLSCDEHVAKALAAIEVRSSKFDALTYMRVRAQDKESGKKGARETPSFTVKVEDLKIVYRWIERYQIPESYFQVFFDSVFAINFLKIFQIIAGGSGFIIETPAKSQEKATILIPITSGIQVGTFESQPTFVAVHRVTRLDRHDAYVKPTGGQLILNKAKLMAIVAA